jgi:hypothetical protein
MMKSKIVCKYCKNIFPLLFLLLLTIACNSPRSHNDPLSQTALTPDSLFTPTGNALLDSLLQLAAVAPQDTTLALIYTQIGDQYENNDFEKANDYYLKLKDLSERLDWNEGRHRYAQHHSMMLVKQRNFVIERFPNSPLHKASLVSIFNT